MFREFFSKNSRSLTIILLLIAGWLLLYVLKPDETKYQLEHPRKGQIYIFQEEDTYAPMRLDSISEMELFMRNYQFLFADAIPDEEQILEQEFDLNFFAIYKKEEINRMFEDGRLVKIYP